MTNEEREKAIETFVKRKKCRATSTDDIIEGTDRKCCETTCDLCPLYYEDDELYEAERIALKALKREHCEDAISRSRLKECFHRNVVNGEAFDDLIDAQPNVTPTREHGEWIKVTNGRGGHECSQCGHYAPSYQNGAEHLSDFCPKCGADMRKEQNNG